MQFQAVGNDAFPLFVQMIWTRSSVDAVAVTRFTRPLHPSGSQLNSRSIYINASILADVGKCTGCNTGTDSLFRYDPEFLCSIKLHCKLCSIREFYGKF